MKSSLKDLSSRSEISQESLEMVSNLVQKIKAEVFQLKNIMESAAKNQELNLAMILVSAYSDIKQNQNSGEIIPNLDQILTSLNNIRNYVSDIYAERYGESCKLQ